MPQMDSTDAEDYWPTTSVLCNLHLPPFEARASTIPQDAQDYSISYRAVVWRSARLSASVRDGCPRDHPRRRYCMSSARHGDYQAGGWLTFTPPVPIAAQSPRCTA